MRLHALAGRGRVVGTLLFLLYLGVHVGVFVTVILYMHSLEYAPSPFPSVVPCYPIRAENEMLRNTYILILCSEIVVMSMTLWICFIRYRAMQSPLLAFFYRDGLGYFWILSLVSAGNIIAHSAAPPGYTYILAIPQCMLHGILSTRMMLHLRKAGSGAATNLTTSETLPLAFLTTEGRDNRQHELSTFLAALDTDTRHKYLETQ